MPADKKVDQNQIRRLKKLKQKHGAGGRHEKAPELNLSRIAVERRIAQNEVDHWVGKATSTTAVQLRFGDVPGHIFRGILDHVTADPKYFVVTNRGHRKNWILFFVKSSESSSVSQQPEVQAA